MTDYCPISFYNKADNNYNYPMNCVYGKKEYNDEVIGVNSMCFESSINLNSYTSICYRMSCDRVNKKILVYIGNRIVECDGEQKIKYVSSSDTLNCPDYNMICTSDIWCNNMFECIDKESLTDENTYLLKSNILQLQQKDNYNLNIDTSSKYTITSGSITSNTFTNKNEYLGSKFIVLFILFVFAFI